MTFMPKQKVNLETARKALKQYFGYDNFHLTQEKAIKSVLSGRDTFVLMPTGGGKSICYQIPALILDGVTIVVSPLIALMKDQVDGLKAYGVTAEYLNSSLDLQEQNEIVKRLIEGKLQIIYVSAERLASPDFAKILKKIKPNLFAIDEAHCISSWGHDFRPDYTNLSHLKRNFPKVPIIALTATADKTTRADILSQLELVNPQQLIDSFDRPNISLTVLPGQKRIEKIRDFLSDKMTQSGIIYCLTRKQTEKLAEKLQGLGLKAASYHAGLNSAERSRIQQSFVRDRTQIICATIAFGMGIDKSNVRWIIHYNLPKNIEGYYQEFGRAGRDSAPAQALLFYTFADVEMIKRFFLDQNQKGIQLGKLDRIKEYAEGVICRRKILLKYFDEDYKKKCHNCDNCQNPYKFLDGTEITKVSLEKLRLLSESDVVDSKSLVNELTKTSDKVSFASWHFYLAQMKNLGLIGVNFSKKQSLFVTTKGREVLEKEKGRVAKKVKLVTLEEFIKRQEKNSKATKSYSKSNVKKDYYKNPLFEKLREVRAEIAKKNSIAAYMVFSDATLLEMANEKPQTKSEMLNVSGVGEVKWERYGEQFIKAIV